MSGYLERLVGRGLGRVGATTLRPRGDARAAEELPGEPATEILQMTQERPAELAASRPRAETVASRESARRGASTTSLSGASSPPVRTLSAPPVAAADRAVDTAPPQLAVRPQCTAAASPPTLQKPSLPLNAPAAVAADRGEAAADHGQPAAHRSATAANASPRLIDSVGPTDRAASESPATAVVRRRQAAVEPEVASLWAASGRRAGDVRFDGDDEPRIEVHIDRVEVLHSTPPPPSPAAPGPRPRHRGFAELAATRGHARRRWC